GRLIGERDACDVDLDEVFRVAARHGKAVEINASPRRLDLADTQARRAAELGAPVSISTDTPAPHDLANIEPGVATARRGRIAPERVVNTWPLERLRGWTAGAARGPAPGRD